MSSGKKRVAKQPVPVQVAGAAPPPLTTATPTSQAARALPITKTPPAVVPTQLKPKASSSTPSTTPPTSRPSVPKPAQHPPVLVASQPIITPTKPSPPTAITDDFPPLPSKSSPPPTQPTSPTTPKASTTPTAPGASQSPSLSDAAAAMIAVNAQSRASKTAALRETLRKVQGGGGGGAGEGGEGGGVVVQGEEVRAKGERPSGADVAGVPPASPVGETNSPLDLSTSSFDMGKRGGKGGDLLPMQGSGSFSAAYSPIHRRPNQTKEDHTDLDDTDLSLDVDDTIDGGSGGRGGKGSTNHPSHAASLAKLNRSLNSNSARTAAGTFASSSQVQAGGLSDAEMAAILAVADDAKNPSDVVSKSAYVSACRHLVRLQAVMNEREEDLRMAGELGEAICAENSKLEAIVEELTHSLDSQIEETKKLEEAKAQLQQQVDELNTRNRKMASDSMAQQVDSDYAEGEGGEGKKKKGAREDTASTALSEFIRSELSTNLLNTSLDTSFDQTGAGLTPASPSSKPIKYTGNIILDLTNLQRKLRRERRMWDRNLQAMEQSVQTKEKERAQLAAEKLRLEQEMETFRELQSSMLKKQTEWEEKEEELQEREERLQHDTKMRLASQKKTMELEVRGKEEELQREREERERESKRRAELEVVVRQLEQRIEELNHQIELWSEEKAREHAARQAMEERLNEREKVVEKLTADVKAAKEEAAKKGKAVEKIVGQAEKGKEAEERRAREIEQRMAHEESRRAEEEQKVASLEQLKQQAEAARVLAEGKRAEEEKRRMAAEGELSRSQQLVTQLQEQLRREKSTNEKSVTAALNAAVAAQPTVITAESTATLATPHAAPKKASATQAESKEVVVLSTAPSVLSPTKPTQMAAPAPMWVLPQPTFVVSARDEKLLSAVFAFLTHQWTISLLLLVSNSRVRKTVEWIKDSQSSECLSCHRQFGILFNRRHHCRLCGGLYCADCANQEVDLEKFGLDNVRVCSACFGVVGVLTHGESLIVHKTKVNQKVKSTDAKKKKAKEAAAALAAAETPRPSSSKAPAPLLTPAPSTAVSISKPLTAPPRTTITTTTNTLSTSAAPAVLGPDATILSGTPRLKKVKSTAASPSSSALLATTIPTAGSSGVKPVAIVRPNGSVIPVTNPSSASPTGTIRYTTTTSSSSPILSTAHSTTATPALMPPEIQALTYNPSPSGPLVTAPVSAPVQKAVPASAVVGVEGAGGGDGEPVRRKKTVVKKVVKRVKPVTLTPASQ